VLVSQVIVTKGYGDAWENVDNRYHDLLVTAEEGTEADKAGLWNEYR
jgi:hypothetical protein